MKHLKYISCGLILFLLFYGCKKNDTEFREFFDNHEVVYTGAVGDVQNGAGNLRVALKWKSSTDPSITKYVVYWNNKLDSQIVDVKGKTDSISTVISGLQEYVYSFSIYSFDSKGNRSIPKEVNNVKVYGPVYSSTLLNRPINSEQPYLSYEPNSVILNFNAPDTINVNTVIKYTSNSGAQAEAVLLPSASSILLKDYKLGTPIEYKSSYIPAKGAIDIFTVASYSAFRGEVPCDKSLFREVRLPGDVNTYEGATSISKLWDGSVKPQGYPNIFHSDGAYISHVLTFDMGKTYTNLTKMEETGRDCCNNPDKFEVWGINDLTGAATTLRADDAGWKAEALSKGWVLLKEATRTDNGQEAMRFDLISNPPPVRYIRVRVLHTVTGSAYSNMSELTFWNYQ